MPVPMFRKRPLIVTADQWFPGTVIPGVEFPAPAADLAKLAAMGERSDPDRTALIRTLEGPFVVWPGDWILTGVKGEKWPVKPDIFALSYTPVSQGEFDLMHHRPTMAALQHEWATYPWLPFLGGLTLGGMVVYALSIVFAWGCGG